MEAQSTFADIESGGRKRVTKREQFLRMMDGIIPWEAWVAIDKAVLSRWQPWAASTRD